MKYLILMCFVIAIATCAMAGDSKSEFFEPSESNAYQGRLLYDASKEDYPIDKMMKLCKAYTGVDTAQTKCKKQNQSSLVICEYKCSLHWSALSNKAPRACCRGLVPKCLACEKGVTEEEWLEGNPEYQVE